MSQCLGGTLSLEEDMATWALRKMEFCTPAVSLAKGRKIPKV